MRLFKTLLRCSHRYLGIPLAFMFVLWFFSAFFMIYTGGMPRITSDQRVDGMEAIDFSRVRLDLADAMAVAGFEAGGWMPEQASLVSQLGRPVYELGEAGYGAVRVAADNGELLDAPTPEEGLQLASRFLDLPPQQLRYTHTLYEPDQWTLSNMRELPLYHYTVDDEAGTRVYVSPGTARVSVYTTRQSRLLAWLGTIPHWLYFEGLRNNQPLWYDIVVYAAYAGCAVALLGLVLGIVQWRRVRPFRLARAIPYQGLMRWHYILGGLFGLFSLTWVFSGLVSMEPWGWTNARGLRISPAALQSELEPQRFAPPAALDWSVVPAAAIKQVEFRMVLDQPWLVASYSVPREAGSSKRDRLHQPYNINGQSAAASVVLDGRRGERHEGFPLAALEARLAEAAPGSAVVARDLLTEYDDYYYSRNRQLPLPVLRLKFDDPAATWAYIDPLRGELLSLIHRYSRIERWLYSGLHSLDFAFWYHKWPLWDLGVIVLLLGGLGLSLLGLWLGLKRLGRDLARGLQLLRRHRSPSAVVTPAKEAAALRERL